MHGDLEGDDASRDPRQESLGLAETEDDLSIVAAFADPLNLIVVECECGFNVTARLFHLRVHNCASPPLRCPASLLCRVMFAKRTRIVFSIVVRDGRRNCP